MFINDRKKDTLKKILALLIGTLLLSGTFVFAAGPAYATGGGTPPPEVCTAQVVDVEGYDEIVTVTEAYDETIVDVPAQDAVVKQWWKFSPNNIRKPFNGPPAFPTDNRGTWQGPHTNGGPQEDAVGTYQNGKGHGSWFHRIQAADAVEEVSHILHHDAVTKTVHHRTTYKKVAAPCEEDETKPLKTRANVTNVDHTCDATGTITLTGEHVMFVIKHKYGTTDPIPAGTYNATLDGTAGGEQVYSKAVVKVIADEGYKVRGQKRFVVKFTEPDCVLPPVEPPVDTPPAVKPPVTDTPSEASLVERVVVTEAGQVLPSTGGPNVGLVIGGLLLITGGLGVLYYLRRRP